MTSQSEMVVRAVSEQEAPTRLWGALQEAKDFATDYNERAGKESFGSPEIFPRLEPESEKFGFLLSAPVNVDESYSSKHPMSTSQDCRYLDDVLAFPALDCTVHFVAVFPPKLMYPKGLKDAVFWARQTAEQLSEAYHPLLMMVRIAPYRYSRGREMPRLQLQVDAEGNVMIIARDDHPTDHIVHAAQLVRVRTHGDVMINFRQQWLSVPAQAKEAKLLRALRSL